MAYRTTAELVQKLLGRDWDGRRDLTPFLRAAYSVVTNLATKAVARGYVHSADELALIEEWVAAHFYTKSDPTYSSRTTQGASGSFVRGEKNAEPYKDGAIQVDQSGLLNAILNRQSAGMFWVGKTVPEQVDYDDRN